MDETRPSVLVAGGSGTLGRAVLGRLGGAGIRARAIGRSGAALARLAAQGVEARHADITDQASLQGVCAGVETVLSCAGASMRLDTLGDRRSFLAVDWRGNRNLLAEAQRAGVRRFVYVSLFGGERLRQTEYADAHERFADELRMSGLETVVIRPTGFFSFFAETLRMARRGRGVVIGTGEPRTNPVHEEDVADVCIAALDGPGGEIALGGPDVLTRRAIAALAFEVLGREPRVRSVKPGLLRMAAAPLRFANPRLHALMHFGIEVSQIDVVAPAVGARDLRSYFEGLAHGEPDTAPTVRA